MTHDRPISLTVFSKVFEKAVHSRSSQQHTNNILKGTCAENATFRVTLSVFKSITQKMHVGGIFWDLAQALIA